MLPPRRFSSSRSCFLQARCSKREIRNLRYAIRIPLLLFFVSYVFVPVAASTFRIRKADMAMYAGQFDYAHALLKKAAGDDVLSPSALYLNGRLYLREYENSLDKDRDLLLHAEPSLQNALGRNNAGFKNFERYPGCGRLH